MEIKSSFNEFRAANTSASFFFTDGSKSDDAVGAAFQGMSEEKSFRLPKDASIFTAELFAILQVLRYIKHKKIMSSVICSDSKSALQAIQNVTCVV
jgi:ribonuclease HI